MDVEGRPRDGVIEPAGRIRDRGEPQFAEIFRVRVRREPEEIDRFRFPGLEIERSTDEHGRLVLARRDVDREYESRNAAGRIAGRRSIGERPVVPRDFARSAPRPRTVENNFVARENKVGGELLCKIW